MKNNRGPSPDFVAYVMWRSVLRYARQHTLRSSGTTGLRLRRMAHLQSISFIRTSLETLFRSLGFRARVGQPESLVIRHIPSLLGGRNVKDWKSWVQGIGLGLV